MAAPAEVFGAKVAVIRLGCLAVDCVGRVALWAANASALCERRPRTLPLHLAVLVLAVQADDAVLATARHAMSHPLLLVDELKVAFARATHRLFVKLLDPFYLVLVVLVGQVQ